ncbi:MAG TPA: tol-pal system-associated acyl-CoA thioesterase [Gammaproteobacteria bacterium]|nr:tol-pal system-associated acyl-CoA thioesterase [Gammaproteobacteria bacterium]
MEFSWPVRIYYEDTDAGGVVYYANYFKFMERARTEWLRSLGFDQRELADGLRLAFVVTEAHAQYVRPARLNDALRVGVDVEAVRGARIRFRQEIRREDELLCAGEIGAACIDLDSFRPRLIPDNIRAQIEH